VSYKHTILTPQTNVTVNPNKTADTFSRSLFYSDNGKAVH